MRVLLRLILLGMPAFLPLAAQDATPPRTAIDADTLEMQGTDAHNYFYFRGNVRVSGDTLEITCRELVVTASRAGDPDATIGEIGAIESIVASGDVRILQAGRLAVAGRAEVDPRAGTVTLSENPRIIDSEVEVEGYQFVFHTADRRVETLPNPDASADEPSRSRVTLSTLPPISFNQPEEAIRMLDRLPPPAEESDQADADEESPAVPATDDTEEGEPSR